MITNNVKTNNAIDVWYLRNRKNIGTSIYIDGSININDKSGRYGWITDKETFISDIQYGTTANRTKLQGVINAIRSQPTENNLTIITDSTYCVFSWKYTNNKISNLKNKSDKPNMDLLIELHKLLKDHTNVIVKWMPKLVTNPSFKQLRKQLKQ